MGILILFLTPFAQAVPETEPAALIRVLEDDDPGVRHRSLGELRKRGSGVETLLRENLGHPDAEVASRCLDLLAEIQRAKAERVVRARVYHVDREISFIVIAAGQEAGVGPGMKFRILSPDGKVRATAQFEKYIGSDRLLSSLVVIQGSAADVMPGDFAGTGNAMPVSPPAEGK